MASSSGSPSTVEVPHLSAAPPSRLPLKGEDLGATCEICNVYLRRTTDLPRHMLLHSKDKESLMFRCPVEGCGHSTLQKSNLATHIRTHTRAKPHKCPETFPDGQKCDFSTADPSSLHRHRKRKHGYTPRQKAIPTQTHRFVHTFAGLPPETQAVDVPESSKAQEGSLVADHAERMSDCDSEESYDIVGAVDGIPASAEDDIDGEGEPEEDTEPVLMSLPSSTHGNTSVERPGPPPFCTVPAPS
ncbi:unnamed protein product [Mycena citricolor]|uniref:C2H2-type domain-containing protein n=1 Tax=Mycena citricolor TaxID=2018698 RepID=A0AAD2HND7_9AGAR|nr:unnamed protein product [Mycena citricolor]